MSPSRAKEILEALAQGVDPRTGEAFSEDGPLSSPHVVRALYAGIRAIERGTAQPTRRHQPSLGFENAGQLWTADEETRLTAEYDRGTTIAALAQAHKRTRGSITSRLVRLGRMEPSTTASSRPNSSVEPVPTAFHQAAEAHHPPQATPLTLAIHRMRPITHAPHSSTPVS